MTKSELKKKLAATFTEFRESDIDEMMKTVIEEIRAGLIQRNGFEIRGFGSFTFRHRKARVARNPRTGDPAYTPERYSPLFRPGKELRARVNNNS